MNRKSLYVSIVLVLLFAVAMMGVTLAGCGEEAVDTLVDDGMTDDGAVDDGVVDDGMTDGDMSPALDIPGTVAGQYVDLTPDQANALMESMPGAIVIDVSPYYADGHLPGAVSYYPNAALVAAIPTLDPEATYLVYCHADGPAIAGAETLVDAGFGMVYRLQGNYSAWVDAGYPVEM